MHKTVQRRINMKARKAMAGILTAAMTMGMIVGGTTLAHADDQITIKVFSNLPDRTSGQGLVEQTIFDQYMAENPNVKIEIEELDDEAYKTKFKAYAAGTEMPDLVSVWGQPGFLNEVIDAGLLAELNPEDYADYGFINGSLDGFSKDGKLYGLARNTDVIGIYYNSKMFEENGWEVPTTYEAFLELCDTINDAGISPVAMDGADKWPLYIYYTDYIQRAEGEGVLAKTTGAIEAADFSDPIFIEAADALRAAAERGVFEVGFETTDYGTAQNLFLNEQAAMYYMGSWDMSIANNQDVPEEVRNAFKVFQMPAPEGANGSDATITAWNGGGYSVTESGANKEEAIKLLNYMFLPENWTRLAWENGVCMSAQDFSQYETGEETELQKEFMDIVANAATMSGTSIGDLGTAEFKTTTEDKIQELAIGSISSQEFLDAIAAVCK